MRLHAAIIISLLVLSTTAIGQATATTSVFPTATGTTSTTFVGIKSTRADGYKLSMQGALKLWGTGNTTSGVNFSPTIMFDNRTATTGRKYYLQSTNEGLFRIVDSTAGNLDRFVINNAGNIGIGTSAPAASALLDVSSTTKGLLAPRMTSAQRTAIASPATGLLVYQTDGTEGLYQFKAVGGWTVIGGSGGGSGTVTSVSVVSANGLGGTVATATTTPAITLTTTVNGMVKGNGTALSAATSGTDYSAGTSALATGILKSTTATGTLSIAVAGDFPILNQNTTGSAGTVSGTNVISNANLAQMAAHTFKGNNGTATANAADLTATQLTAELNTFTTAAKGLVPAPVTSNTTDFLRRDGTWAAPPGGGTGTVTSVSVVSANGFSGTVATATTTPAITLTTSVSGVLKGSGGSLAAAVAGDFPTLNQNTTGTAANVTGTIAVANGGTGLTTIATGDLLYGSATNVVGKLTAGANGRVLTMGSTGVPEWAVASGGGAVSSVFGRTGAVIAQTGDYTFAQIGSKPTTLAGYGITDAIQNSTTQQTANFNISGNGTAATSLTVGSTYGATWDVWGTHSRYQANANTDAITLLTTKNPSSIRLQVNNGGRGVIMDGVSKNFLFMGGSGETLGGIGNVNGTGNLALLYSTAPNSHTEGARLTTTGSFLIGTTTSPSGYKLAVAGNIIAEKVRVKLQSTGWPDYVFESNYHLPTLQQTEQFIQQHKHLPGVPSAATIEKEGLDLGDGQAVLLKKIEELTLYMIEMNKKVEKLEADNEIMKKQLQKN